MTDSFERKLVTGLILAGGAGRRVGGQDKGLLPWHGQPLVQHVVQRLTPQVGKLLISCNRNQQRYLDYAPTLVTDKRSDYQGPLAGLEASLATIDTPWICMVACDVPDLPCDLVSRLYMSMNLPDTSPDVTPIACAHDGERAQFLCALLRRECIASVSQYLDSGQRSVGGWYHSQGLLEVDFADQPDAFLNLNAIQQDSPA